jgi:hypothetical protein
MQVMGATVYRQMFNEHNTRKRSFSSTDSGYVEDIVTGSKRPKTGYIDDIGTGSVSTTPRFALAEVQNPTLVQQSTILTIEPDIAYTLGIDSFGESTDGKTFEPYVPKKLKIGIKHPDSIVETSSLSAVSPPNITYKLALPSALINSGAISNLQLEAIVYACQRFEKFMPNGQRFGFFIGDGAGVGKGRELAGLIFECWRKNLKKAIWLSVSSDLKQDAARDLADIGCQTIPLHLLGKLPYGHLNGEKCGYVNQGVIFSTYSSLISGTNRGKAGGKQNVNNSRIEQLIDWCGADYDGLILLDECHKAKNILGIKGKPSKTGLAVMQLQNRLPKARIVYCSATGVSEPSNMAYMSRLGIWGDNSWFPNFEAFLHTIEDRGFGAMEVVAMDMKLMGMVNHHSTFICTLIFIYFNEFY